MSRRFVLVEREYRGGRKRENELYEGDLDDLASYLEEKTGRGDELDLSVPEVRL